MGYIHYPKRDDSYVLFELSKRIGGFEELQKFLNNYPTARLQLDAAHRKLNELKRQEKQHRQERVA